MRARRLRGEAGTRASALDSFPPTSRGQHCPFLETRGPEPGADLLYLPKPLVAAGPPERENDDDLHPCTEPRRPGSAEPAGPVVMDKHRGHILTYRAEKPS